MADLGIDWSGCSIVEPGDPEKLGGKPTLRGLRISADQILENYDYNMTAEEIADTFELELDDVTTLITYAKNSRKNDAHIV